MHKNAIKRTVDMQIMADWVETGSRVLDLGCGRGVLMEFLAQSKGAEVVGVDLDVDKISNCIKRGVTAYQGDMMDFMRAFPDDHFDRVICSRTVEELGAPNQVIAEALRVGRALTVGFVNHGYWKNRLDVAWSGRKPRNAVYTTDWHESRPANPATIADFESFCAAKHIRIARRVHLRGDWQTPCSALPNLLAGYALYDLARGNTTPATAG
ncbi:MAG: methyltransferase domain-containing protein [Opitutaceae bacterium]|nr:methyltransferase domain-containing protein [Opitutaceae bacterium]